MRPALPRRPLGGKWAAVTGLDGLEAIHQAVADLSRVVVHLFEQLFDIVQLDRLLVLCLMPSEHVDLAAGDLVVLERALLSMERSHATDEGLGDLKR